MMLRRGCHSQARRNLLFPVVVCLVLCACHHSHNHGAPSIEFKRIPPTGEGSPDKLEPIEGRVSGAMPGERIVLFALSGMWWVQPVANQPFTAIQSDSTWKSWTHPGSAYAALLVDSNFRPPATLTALPETGGAVLARAVVQGTKGTPQKIVEFSGYQWAVRSTASDRGGVRNVFAPANVWTDSGGFLHLRVARQAERWTSAEVKLSRSLGYGLYRFVVRDVSHLKPAAVFSLFTWDDSGPSREMDVEISRWGEPQDKNAQYVVQPYFVPANTVRFNTPPGTLTFRMLWEPGRVSFKTVRGSSSNNQSDVIAEHVFTSGVPSPGDERVHMNVYVYDNKRRPLQHDFEVVVEKFEFLP
jgi:hypothetical protein